MQYVQTFIIHRLKGTSNTVAIYCFLERFSDSKVKNDFEDK